MWGLGHRHPDRGQGGKPWRSSHVGRSRQETQALDVHVAISAEVGSHPALHLDTQRVHLVTPSQLYEIWVTAMKEAYPHDAWSPPSSKQIKIFLDAALKDKEFIQYVRDTLGTEPRAGSVEVEGGRAAESEGVQGVPPSDPEPSTPDRARKVHAREDRRKR